MWADQDKLEVITRPKYLKELTRLRGDPVKKRGGKEGKYEEGLKEMNMYLVFGVNSKVARGNPQGNSINILLK